MGQAKRDHIPAMPDVASRWNELHGTACPDADIGAMYDEFLPLQKQMLHRHSQLIDGVPELAEWFRKKGLKIGSSMGYTRELLTVVTAAAADQGYVADCVLSSEDAPSGRPAPFLL